MPKTEMIGKAHTEQLTWLSDTWVQSGPPVCFLEGFPGTGKTTIARHLLDKVNQTGKSTILITAPDMDGDPTDDLLLDLAMELSLAGHKELANAIDDGRSLTQVLHTVVEAPIVIIIDEFQRTMRGDSSKPAGEFAKVLSTIASRRWLKGRILLLTNRLVERASWSEAYAIRTVPGMEPEDGVHLLNRLLEESNRQDEIPFERRQDVVKWLAGNPRAIRVLVSSLAYDSLDDLIGLGPELWETKERFVSAELVGALERELLQRTLNQLSSAYNQWLNSLAVYRKPFKREATEALFANSSEASEFRRVLIDRFLMEQHLGWYNLHPIVREIGLQRLRQAPADLKRAHSAASRYYTRHFAAKQVVGWGQLGGHFVEARYHLINAGNETELGVISAHFEEHIKATISLVSPVPNSSEELDERIAVLSALLETPGPKGLEYHLARLFQARGRRSDLDRAIVHAQRALGPEAPAPTWILCSNLLAQAGRIDDAIALLKERIAKVPPNQPLYQSYGEMLAKAGRIDDAIALLKEGVAKVSPDKGLSSLYQSCGELLAKAGRIDDAIALLKDGIAKVPPDQNLFSLYQSCGEMLAKAGRIDEAIALLKEGIAKVPPNKGLFFLYQSCGELLAKAGRIDDAIALLKEGIAKVPPNQGLSSLYQSCGAMLAKAGRIDEAIALLKDGIAKVPPNQPLYQSCGEMLAQAGRIDDAIALLKDGIAKVPPDQPLYQSYGEMLAQAGRIDEAIALLKEGIAKVPPDQNLFSLYQSCGEMLAKAGRIDDAIALLKEGIAKVPPNQGLSSLYQSCGELLAKAGRIDEAIALLKDGIAKVPPEKGLSSLYQSCGELLAQAGRIDDAIALLKDGIAKVPPDKGLSSLYQSCGEMLAQAGRIDDAIALLKERIAKVPPNQPLYQSYGEMLAQARRIDEAIALLKEGIAKVPPDQNLFSLYQSCGEMLAKAGRIDDAIALLKEGIAKVPPDKGLFSLYQSCGEMLAQAGRIDEAIALLKEGIAKVPPEKGLSSLYQSCGAMLAQAGRIDEAIGLLKDGIAKVPPNQGQYKIVESFLRISQSQGNGELFATNLKFIGEWLSGPQVALAETIKLQLNEQWLDAAACASRGRKEAPIYIALVAEEAISWLGVGDAERALHALDNVSRQISYEIYHPNCWLRALIECQLGNQDATRKYLAIFLGKNSETLPQDDLLHHTLLTLWDTPQTDGETALAYFFPTLPPKVTGLNQAVTRTPYQPPILTFYSTSRPKAKVSSNASLAFRTKGTMGADFAADIQKKRASGEYDVFLCHNSSEKAPVKRIGQALLDAGLLPWLDEWDIRPGQRWQRVLQDQIGHIRSAAVFVGPDGIAPWQDMEVEALLAEFTKREIPIIPVILPECAATPTLPLFLGGFQWVDFRKVEPEPVAQLIWGITGEKPLQAAQPRSRDQVSSPAEPGLVEQLRDIIRAENEAMRVALIKKLDQTSDIIINELSGSQIAILNSFYEVSQANQLQKNDFDELFAAITKLRRALPTDQTLAQALQAVDPVVEDASANVHHRLKVTLPIVPLLLSYEAECEMSSGVNVVSILTNIIARLRRH